MILLNTMKTDTLFSLQDEEEEIKLEINVLKKVRYLLLLLDIVYNLLINIWKLLF